MWGFGRSVNGGGRSSRSSRRILIAAGTWERRTSERIFLVGLSYIPEKGGSAGSSRGKAVWDDHGNWKRSWNLILSR